jgi:hypothetical protein
VKILSLVLLTLFASASFATNPTLILTNQFGEISVNTVNSNSTFISVPIAANTVLSNITGSSAYPVANTYAAVSAKLTPAMLLTGYVAGAGTVAASDTVLQAIQKLGGNTTQLLNGTPSLTTETITSAGAISTTVSESILSNAGGGNYAATLAAPSSQDGQLKVLKMGTATHAVTLAMTNISITGGFTGAGTTTLTFTNSGDSAILMAVGSKWVYLGGSAVAS